MGVSAAIMVCPSLNHLHPTWGCFAAPAASDFANSGKVTKTPFKNPWFLKISFTHKLACHSIIGAGANLRCALIPRPLPLCALNLDSVVSYPTFAPTLRHVGSAVLSLGISAAIVVYPSLNSPHPTRGCFAAAAASDFANSGKVTKTPFKNQGS